MARRHDRFGHSVGDISLNASRGQRSMRPVRAFLLIVMAIKFIDRIMKPQGIGHFSWVVGQGLVLVSQCQALAEVQQRVVPPLWRVVAFTQRPEQVGIRLFKPDVLARLDPIGL